MFGLKPGTPLICAVEQLAYYLDNLNTKIVIKVDSHNIDEVTYAFQKTSIKDRVSKITKVDIIVHTACDRLYLII